MVHSKRARALLFLTAMLGIALLLAACGGGDEDGAAEPEGVATDEAAEEAEDDAESVRVAIAITPYFEYQPWIIAHELGLDAEQGLNFVNQAAQSTTNAVAAMRRGEFDVVSSCHACNYPLYKEVPELRDWMITNQFKGFIVVGKKGETETYEDLEAELGEEGGREQILNSFKGKTFALNAVIFRPLLASALSQVGLTPDDVEIVDFPDDAKAALAFQRGTGDYYMGSLPQETKLTLGSPDKYVNVGGHEILGPAGLWYSTMVSLEPWIEENKDVVMRMLAVWYRTMRYLNERPEETIPQMTTLINEHAAAGFTEDEVRFILSEFEHFFSLDEARELAFNPDSDIYWKLSAEHYAEQSEEDLPEDFSIEEFMIEDEIFNEFLEQDELIEWVNAPLD